MKLIPLLEALEKGFRRYPSLPVMRRIYGQIGATLIQASATAGLTKQAQTLLPKLHEPERRTVEELKEWERSVMMWLLSLEKADFKALTVQPVLKPKP